jgi:protein-S-isoprenylcysteine O-methyltransferase Ste14
LLGPIDRSKFMMKGGAGLGRAPPPSQAPSAPPLFLQALWLLWRSHADLADSFSPGLQIRKNHVLVTKGVYENIRHSMYAAHLLWAIAQLLLLLLLLLLQNWIAGPAFLVASIPQYVAWISREEEMMEDEFGEEYRRYMERTGRVMLRIGG